MFCMVAALCGEYCDVELFDGGCVQWLQAESSDKHSKQVASLSAALCVFVTPLQQ